MGAFEFVVSEGPSKGQTFAFPAERFTVGSSPECQLRLDAQLVQPLHAEISVSDDAVSVRDLTANGAVWLNGERRGEGTVSPGSFVRLGSVELVVRQLGTSASASGTIATPLSDSGGYRVSGVKPIALDVTAKRPTPFASAAMQAAMSAPAALKQTPYGRDLGPHGSLSDLAPGTTIDGRYLIISKLAAGGMGEVYKAEHVELGKLFAIKVMLPELSRDAEFVARFKREAISASRIGQQNIVDISDFGQTQNGRFYFVMEFLDGLTLASVTHREGAVRVDRVLNVAVQVTRALAAAHAQGIVHRDLKPENIMLLQRTGQPDFVKVLDFGVAKVNAGHGQGGQTAIGMVVGTPQYMSPEQAKAIPVDTRSDVYSLGLIFYELLTGRPTFVAETPSMLMVKHVTEAPPPFEPGPLGEVPVDLETLIFKMLEKEPANRPQTMEEIVTALDTMWTRLKSNDPTLRRISGEFPAAGQKRAARKDAFSDGPSKTPVRKTPVKVSGGTKTPIKPKRPPPPRSTSLPAAVSAAPGEDSQGAASDEEASASDELTVSRSKAPLIAVGLLVAAAVVAAGVFFTQSGPGAASTVVAESPLPAPANPARAADPVPPAAKEVESAKAPEPVKPAEPATVVLTFESSPPAVVREGDATLGTTPIRVMREENSTIKLTFAAAGHASETKTYKFVVPQTFNIELRKEMKTVKPPRKKVPVNDPSDLKDLE